MAKPYTHKVLGNGLGVLNIRLPQKQSVAIGIWLHAGGRYEDKKTAGLSHFMEHIVFKGTRTRSCRRLKESIEGLGGTLNAFTGEELTCFLSKILKKHTRLALDVLSDMVLNPRLDAGDIQKEKDVIVEEICMYKDQPGHYVIELLQELMWPDQPLGMNLAGTPETVRSFQRLHLAEFKEKFYGPKNILIAVAGDLKDETVISEAERFFKRRPAGRKHEFLKAHKKQDRPLLRCLAKDTEQTHISLGFHGLSLYHRDKEALKLLDIIAGANMSSRLFNRVREDEGLAYSIGSKTHFFRDAGSFVVGAGIDNKKVLRALELIIEELGKLKSTLVGPSELTRAKEYYAGQLLMAMEDTLDQMFWGAEKMIYFNTIPSIRGVISKIQKVTPRQIREVARRLLTKDNINLAMIGPLEEEERSGAEEILYKQ